MAEAATQAGKLLILTSSRFLPLFSTQKLHILYNAKESNMNKTDGVMLFCMKTFYHSGTVYLNNNTADIGSLPFMYSTINYCI